MKQASLFEQEGSFGFDVELDVFAGPFDVLLSLIAKRKLDITEVALAEVTDEFLEHARAAAEFDLAQASEFLVVAATLLALKAQRLLPQDADDEEDLELLEARDLLFAKLLQHRAYRDLALLIARRMAETSLAVPRSVPLEPSLRGLMPDPILPGPAGLLELAQAVFDRDRSEPQIILSHLHDPLVPVESQVEIIEDKLAGSGEMSFAQLCADAPTTATVISRFLAVLQLLVRRRVRISQDRALGDLIIIREDT